MSFYLYFNLLIIAFPLIFSFEKRIKFYKKIKPLLVSLFIVGIFFIAWDVFATSRGHWSFNPLYVNEVTFLGIPLEEVLFFVTVPYSCIFVFNSIIHFLEDKQLFCNKKWIFLLVGLTISLSAFLVQSMEYTFLAILSVGLTIIAVSLVNPDLFASKAYWIYAFLTLILFLIFNYILTSTPVVLYSPTAITGFRVTTIPIEDFLFNYSMLTNYLMVYLWATKKAKTITKQVIV
jgi:lycopene cyclase domain-containing protein